MKSKGFTLIELLVVISIISLLSSVVITSLNSARADGRDAVRKADMNSLRTAIELYRLNNTQYPANPASTRVENMNTGSSDITPYISPIPNDPTQTGSSGYRYQTSAARDGYVLMVQLEADNHNSWCKFVMEPGDGNWGNNASYKYLTDPDCS